MNSFNFPSDFKLGVASAATQIDGDCKNSNWYDWYLKGNIKDNSNPDIATEHRHFLKEDTELMAQMGICHYRFGLEWARIEPLEGKFSDDEFKKVREEILLLKSNGISVLLTIHHFSNPMWFENKGAFLSSDSKQIFLRLVRKVTEELGDIVNEFITINEPNVYAVNSFFGGGFPPNHNSLFKALKVMKNMRKCHIESYLLIHSIRKKMGFTDTQVGFAHHMRAFSPWDSNKTSHKLIAKASKWLFQGNINKTYLLGSKARNAVYADFLAVNYYTRTASKSFADDTYPNSPVNDLGWEIYPEGIAECCRDLHLLLPHLPIYITENGTADNDDRFRRRYIYEHLKALVDSGLPVKRYYHWCFVDNFEWLEGFSARFGLVYLDTKTMKRQVKRSGEFYSEMIKNHGVTEEMAAMALGEEYSYN